MKTVIKEKEKLLENLQMPIFDYNDKYCSQSQPDDECPYYDGLFGSCNLFIENLETDDGLELRCQKCLDCFGVEDEN